MNKVADDKKATRELNRMLKLKLILKTGENKNRRYFLNPTFN